MHVMTVKEAHNNVLFTVTHEEHDYRAVQLVDRISDQVYANTVVEVGDRVLVVEIPGLLYGPRMSKADSSEAVSHIIVGLIPSSHWHEIRGYSELVR